MKSDKFRPSVCYSKTNKGFVARLRTAGEEVWIGTYDTREEALDACNRVISGEPVEKVRPRKRAHKDSASGVEGVYPVKGKWKVSTVKDGERKEVGYYSTKEEAIKAKELFLAGKPYKKQKRLGSVYKYSQHGKWTGKWAAKFRTKHCGYYDTEREAERALDNANKGIFPKPARRGRKPKKVEAK